MAIQHVDKNIMTAWGKTLPCEEKVCLYATKLHPGGEAQVLHCIPYRGVTSFLVNKCPCIPLNWIQEVRLKF